MAAHPLGILVPAFEFQALGFTLCFSLVLPLGFGSPEYPATDQYSGHQCHAGGYRGDEGHSRAGRPDWRDGRGRSLVLWGLVR